MGAPRLASSPTVGYRSQGMTSDLETSAYKGAVDSGAKGSGLITRRFPGESVYIVAKGPGVLKITVEKGRGTQEVVMRFIGDRSSFEIHREEKYAPQT